MRNPIRKHVVKGIAISVFALSTFIVFGGDGIKRFVLDEAELLCRIKANTVDTISFSAIRDDDIASGADFLNMLNKILATSREKNMTLSNELRLYLGCKLPLEMKQTIFQVVSEHYAKRFAQGNYTISSTAHDYAHKLVGRGFFQDIDRILVLYGYKVKSVFLEKVSIDRSTEQAFAFTDITLTKRDVYSSNSTLEQKGQTLPYMFYCICLEECGWISRRIARGLDFVRTIISYENNCQGPIAERYRWLRKQVMSISYPRSGTFVARALYNASAGVLPHCRIR